MEHWRFPPPPPGPCWDMTVVLVVLMARPRFTVANDPSEKLYNHRESPY